MKIKSFRGDLTDISAKKEALRMTSEHSNDFQSSELNRVTKQYPMLYPINGTCILLLLLISTDGTSLCIIILHAVVPGISTVKISLSPTTLHAVAPKKSVTVRIQARCKN